jgi:hypothetical protein
MLPPSKSILSLTALVCGRITLCLLCFAIQNTVDLGILRYELLEHLRCAINSITSIIYSPLYLREKIDENT